MNSSKQDHVIVVGQPSVASGTGQYLLDGFRDSGARVDLVDCRSLRFRKIWPALRCFRFNKTKWQERRWVEAYFSERAWRRNTRLNEQLLGKAVRTDSKVLQVGATYFPHRNYRTMEYYVYILYTMRLCQADGVKPWVPDAHEFERYCDLEAELFQCARHVFTGGAYVKQNLMQAYGVPETHVTAAGGGAHAFYLEHDPGETAAPWTYTLLFVGWDFGYKGGASVVEAFRRLKKEIPPLRLVIIGPPSSPDLDQEGVLVTGPIHDRSRILEWYRAADLFVMPSLCDSYGYVYLEAMSQGVPCLGANINAQPELILHGETGYIVEPNNADQIVECIRNFYSDPRLKEDMGRRAKARVHEQFSWALVNRRIRDVMYG